LYFGGHFWFKMAAIANQMMNINSQHHNLLGNQILPKSEDFGILIVVHLVFIIFKMAANIKIKKIVKNSKMKRFQWKWIFTRSN
jgi:hypothetical protein